MKKLLMIAAATAAILPMAAQAGESANSTINLSAKAPNTCQIRDIKNVSNSSNSKSVKNGTVTFDNAVDKDSATVKETTSANLTLDAFCNYAGHDVTLKSKNGGLINTAETATVGTFNRRIGYEATLNRWSNDIGTLTLSATGPMDKKDSNPVSKYAKSTYTAVNTSDAKLSITTLTADDGNPLLEGDYSDVMTIQLGVKLD